MSPRPGVYQSVVSSAVVSRNPRNGGELHALTLKCGHVAIRMASWNNKRAFCEVCTQERKAREAAERALREAAKAAAPKPEDWRETLRRLVAEHGASVVLDALAELETSREAA